MLKTADNDKNDKKNRSSELRTETIHEAVHALSRIRDGREDGVSHSIGDVLKKYRKNAGMTQADLAEKMQVHKNTILAWEKDSQMPSLEKTMDLCLLLHMPIQELCGIYEGEPSSAAAAPSDPLEDSLRDSFDQLSDNYKQMLVNIADTMAQQQQEERTRMLRDDVSFFEHSVTKAAAGPGCSYGDIDYDYRFIRYNPAYRSADAVVTVDGHSMEPVYHDGDMVYVRYQNSASDGSDVICGSNDGQVIKRKEGGICVSLNPDPQYKYEKHEDDNVHIVAKVLGIVNPDDIMDESTYPELEEIHHREIRAFNREHGIEY